MVYTHKHIIYIVRHRRRFIRGKKGEPLQELRTSDEQRLSPANGNSELRPPADVTARPPGYVRDASPVNGAGGYKYWLRRPRRHFFRDRRPDHISLSPAAAAATAEAEISPRSHPLKGRQ